VLFFSTLGFLFKDFNSSNYVNSATSSSQNLTFATSDTFILRTDYKTVLDPNGPGRNSVRIRSKKTYTTHVAV
jgi:flagellar assembly factor FliW